MPMLLRAVTVAVLVVTPRWCEGTTSVTLLKVDDVSAPLSTCPGSVGTLGGRRPFWEPGQCNQEVPAFTGTARGVFPNCGTNSLALYSGPTGGCPGGELESTLTIGGTTCQEKIAGYDNFPDGNYSLSCVSKTKANMLRWLSYQASDCSVVGIYNGVWQNGECYAYPGGSQAITVNLSTKKATINKYATSDCTGGATRVWFGDVTTSGSTKVCVQNDNSAAYSTVESLAALPDPTNAPADATNAPTTTTSAPTVANPFNPTAPPATAPTAGNGTLNNDTSPSTSDAVATRAVSGIASGLVAVVVVGLVAVIPAAGL